MSKIKKAEYYGFDHKKVNKMFEGGLTFLNEFCVNNEYHPVAVYKVAKPNREKGHKDYLLLNGPPLNCVRGMTQEEIDKWRFQDALYCHECDTVLYSINRHHFIYCGCPNNTFIDGGKDYTKYGAKDMNKVVMLTLDLLTDTTEIK